MKLDFLRAQPELSPGKDLSDETMQEYIAFFVRELESAFLKTDPSKVIALAGRIASGKSTLARALSESLQIPILRTDSIRTFLRAQDYNLMRTIELSFFVAMKVIKDGYGLILDLDLQGSDQARSAIEEVAPHVLWIYIDTPEDVILKRLNAPPTPEREYVGVQAIERYYARSIFHQDVDFSLYDFVYRGDQPLEPQLNKILTLL